MAKLLLRLGVVVGVIVAAGLVLRACRVQRGPSLSLWHTVVPRELDAASIDGVDWVEYVAAEAALFETVRTEVTDRLPPEARVVANRYWSGSPLYPGRFATDWNRSYILEPERSPVGAVVLLHGLTDSPYSMRHLAQYYRARGFVAVVVRLPGHGTVPSGLTQAVWEDWAAATRLAVREARRRVGPPAPLHLAGYSNGGAMAMKYTLDALGGPSSARPERVVLVSPMIGVTAFARFAGVVGWPAAFPAFAEAAWLNIVPEFNPFKYNSFPVNAARQSSLVARRLQRQITELAGSGRLADLPPVLTFQSVVDSTVSTRAVVSALYDHLPSNGSELVLFDLNRHARFGPLLTDAASAGTAVLPPLPRRYRTTLITNAGSGTDTVEARIAEAGAVTERVEATGLAYPPEVFSLSHVALPFPLDDALYGLRPDHRESFGVNLGAIAPRGERGALIISLDSVGRLMSNPFYSWMQERIGEGIAR